MDDGGLVSNAYDGELKQVKNDKERRREVYLLVPFSKSVKWPNLPKGFNTQYLE